MLHGVFCLNENKYKNIHLKSIDKLWFKPTTDYVLYVNVI
jgi:hypothetical protein